MGVCLGRNLGICASKVSVINRVSDKKIAKNRFTFCGSNYRSKNTFFGGASTEFVLSKFKNNYVHKLFFGEPNSKYGDTPIPEVYKKVNVV